MREVAARRGVLAGALLLLCAACAPTTYMRPGTSQSQGERDLEACRLEGLARVTETLPRVEDYRVEVSAFEPGPYDLESRMRFAAQDAAEGAYASYFDEQVRVYIAPCMQRKSYRARQLPLTTPGQHETSQHQGRNHV